MAEIINLRLARKRKERADMDEHAAANRTKYGQPKSARKKREAEKALAAKRLDGHKREPEA
ncbi:DUF4169 family protein [Pelagibacterium limicola]|uniref:DUF4169 family protein n=1 Tax=Pelagibacterium limicola TaxID=2791022 RepID=UPI0018AF85B7|nr:DUF4169 family protein [Pelagibacterium limicola]